MTLRKTHDPVLSEEHGRPCFNYHWEGPEGGGVLFTGPVAGSIRLSDGTVYSVTEEVIEHAPGHAGPICHHIEMMHEVSGVLGADFHHDCTDRCGAEAVAERRLPAS